MNNKILLNILIPEISTSYDVFIPINITVSELNTLLKQSISELAEYNFDNKARIYYQDNGNEIDASLIIKNTNLRNGSKIILL
jgi:hypothetical protein